MSNELQASSYQQALKGIRTPLDAWYATIPANQLIKGAILNLRLTHQELALASSWWPTPHRKIIITKSSPQKANTLLKLCNAWNTFFSHKSQWHVIAGELTEQEQEGIIHTELNAAYHYLFEPAAQTTHNFIIVAKPALPRLPNPGIYQANTANFTVGQKVPKMSETLQQLVRAGYVRHTRTRDKGSFLVNGDQIDITHPTHPGHYTLQLYGSIIESITHTIEHRRYTKTRIALPPLRLPPTTGNWNNICTHALLFRPAYYHEYQGNLTIIHDSLIARSRFPWHQEKNISLSPPGKKIIIMYRNAERVQHYLATRQYEHAIACASPLADIPFSLTHTNTHLASEAHALPSHEHVRAITYEKGLELLGSLKVGQPAVHSDHGIGIFEGLHRRAIAGSERDYLVLRYASGDSLSIPVEYAHKVSAYVGDKPPQLHRLGNVGSWLRVRRQATQQAAALARELLGIAKRRHQLQRTPFTIDPEADHALTKNVPYELTAGQQHTWQEIISDLSAPEPMDRLVVGDVGFGKTEVAQRAAFHVARSGYQVAIIAPTTLLVQQHADTFRTRLAGQNITLGMLSRFISRAERSSLQEKIAGGHVQIVIGTHALLSPKLHWKKLGLIIIDEEQRFGVTQKEHFKKIRATVDVLSLTATPIPRTLSMALSGLRQLSLITTPPVGRKSVHTTVAKEKDELLTQALLRENARSGQTYVVNPRVQALPALMRRVQKLLPHARVAMAHGQMADADLARVMEQFDNNELEVLVASSIIENGLDLPNANTIIVTDATRFGLSDLYQLRGRIGRRQRQGYAYFLYNQHTLTPIQRQRLTAITEATRLGSGWELARRDLEIRGAGNLLGAEQSGAINAIGIQLYLDLVREAVADQTGSTRPPEVDIQLPITAYLPPEYIQSLDERTRWYQRISRASSLKILTRTVDELTRTYGQLPPPAATLIQLIRLQHAAAKSHIIKIESQIISPPNKPTQIRLQLTSTHPIQSLARLQKAGSWTVRNNQLLLDVPKIDESLLTKLVNTLIV